MDISRSCLLTSRNAEDFAHLTRLLQGLNWTVYHASTTWQALECLESCEVAVLVSELELADGGWREILRAAMALPHPPMVVVSSFHADGDMWAEALNLGGYDVLTMPIEEREALHVITSAWLAWLEEEHRQMPDEAVTSHQVAAASQS